MTETLPLLIDRSFDHAAGRYVERTLTVHEDGLTETVGCGGTLVVATPEREDDIPAIRCTACDEYVATLCASCREEWVTVADESNGEAEMLDDGTTISGSCRESEQSNGSTVTRFSAEDHDGSDSVSFGDLLAWGEQVSYDEQPEWFGEMFPNGHKRPWVATSGWRGHFDTWSTLTGYTKIVDGWVTGDYDDVPWKRDTHRLAQALLDNAPPVDVFILAEPTSNVFSTAVDIFTRDADHDAVVAWLETLDFTEEGLRRAFG